MLPLRKTIDVIRYNLEYIISEDPNVEPIPTWIREDKSFSLKNKNDITGEVSTDIIEFTTDDLNEYYPKNITNYSYFDKVEDQGPLDSEGNPKFIEIAISNSSINLFTRSGNITKTNKNRIWRFSDEYVIPNDYYHNRGNY